MKKFSIISLIILLILFTAFIKNKTKRIDDEIFLVKENIKTKTAIFFIIWNQNFLFQLND